MGEACRCRGSVRTRIDYLNSSLHQPNERIRLLYFEMRRIESCTGQIVGRYANNERHECIGRCRDPSIRPVVRHSLKISVTNQILFVPHRYSRSCSSLRQKSEELLHHQATSTKQYHSSQRRHIDLVDCLPRPDTYLFNGESTRQELSLGNDECVLTERWIDDNGRYQAILKVE